LRVFDAEFLRRMYVPGGGKDENGKACVICSFLVCIFRHILLRDEMVGDAAHLEEIRNAQISAENPHRKQ
jgi:hypothetical protein